MADRTNFCRNCVTLQERLDGAVELLRQAMPGLERGGASEVLGRIDAYFAYREPCQRCGGDGKIPMSTLSGTGDVTEWERTCPECNGGAS